jgi:hypothetical protein
VGSRAVTLKRGIGLGYLAPLGAPAHQIEDGGCVPGLLRSKK